MIVETRQNRLDIRVENHRFGATDVTGPIATILIDGVNVFENATGFIGFDPDDLLGPDQPLLPAASPRRVAVYQCGCGEPGCGVLAPVVSGTGTEVRWTDFQNFTASFDGPLSTEVPTDGRPQHISDLIFASAQYFEEVKRAAADRSWETPVRTTARLLSAMLEEISGALADLDLSLEWVFPAHCREAGVSLSLLDITHRYVNGLAGRLILTLDAGPGTPKDRAAEMFGALMSTAPDQWMRVFPWESLGTC